MCNGKVNIFELFINEKLEIYFSLLMTFKIDITQNCIFYKKCV